MSLLYIYFLKTLFAEFLQVIYNFKITNPIYRKKNVIFLNLISNIYNGHSNGLGHFVYPSSIPR